MQNTGIYGRAASQKYTAYLKEGDGLSCICQNLNKPCILGISGRHVSHYIWCKANTARHNKNVMQTAKHGGGRMLCGCLALVKCFNSCSASNPVLSIVILKNLKAQTMDDIVHALVWLK